MSIPEIPLTSNLQTLLRQCESLLTMHDRSKAWLRERDELLRQLRAALSGDSSAPETAGEPTLHHVCYDRLGWACSICGGWNDAAAGVVCRWSHKSAQETSKQPHALYHCPCNDQSCKGKKSYAQYLDE